MPKPFVDLNTNGNKVIVIVRAHVAYIRENGPITSDIGLISGEAQTVLGTVPELVEKIWPVAE